MPSITIREYHPESGALLGNVSALDFGKVTVGTHSRVKVLDIAFEGTSSVGNVKLGIISSGGISVFSGGVGHFGITSSADFNATLASAPVSSHFLGVNTTATSTDTNNVSVALRGTCVTNYIYLDIEIGTTNVRAGNGAYKVFFDYA